MFVLEMLMDEDAVLLSILQSHDINSQEAELSEAVLRYCQGG